MKTSLQRSQSFLVLGPQVKELKAQRDALFRSLQELARTAALDSGSPAISPSFRIALEKSERLIARIQLREAQK